jgi:hypothetical protein
MSEGLDRQRLLVALREGLHPLNMILGAVVRHGSTADFDVIRCAVCEVLVSAIEMREAQREHRRDFH